jgi:CHAD domain-containing protein
MKPEIFEKYIRRLYAGLKTLQDAAIRTAEVEAIHDMRVQIKRLSCIYTFLEESKIAPVRKDKYYSELRKYFKTAGRLREFQLHQIMIDVYKKKFGDHFAEYESYNSSQGRFFLEHFSRNQDYFPGAEQKSIRSAILLAVKNTDQDQLKRQATAFIKARLKRIENYYLNYASDIYLHKTRQTIKELRYFLELHAVCSGDAQPPSVNFEEIKKVEELLGGWNDKRIFREDVERFVRNYSMIHAKGILPAYQELMHRIEEDARNDIKDIQPVLLHLITNMSLNLLTLK